MLASPVPTGMQHSGLFPSQPLGHLVPLHSPLYGHSAGGPPKQRRIPFASGLQTLFFP